MHLSLSFDRRCRHVACSHGTPGRARRLPGGHGRATFLCSGAASATEPELPGLSLVTTLPSSGTEAGFTERYALRCLKAKRAKALNRTEFPSRGQSLFHLTALRLCTCGFQLGPHGHQQAEGAGGTGDALFF